MYEEFYGLEEKPFNLTPDPRFLYLSPKHKEAFAHLLYGIRNRSGFIMISGEIGTGKTTICRSLLKRLDPNTEVAYIFNPYLSPMELLRTINEDFGIDSQAESTRGLIDELNVYLLAQAAGGKNCVLIIDEAQNLGSKTLEQIRLLSNLETETDKLLQIVLIGQPELPQKLKLSELRQLNQRIIARYHLGALNREETLHYIAFRLRVAGGRRNVRFTKRAIRLIYRISGGTPRVINALCDRALLIGYTQEIHVITPAIVRKAAAEIRGEDAALAVKSKGARLAPRFAVLLAGLVIVFGAILAASGPVPSYDEVRRVAVAQWPWAFGDGGSQSETTQAGVPGAESASSEVAPTGPREEMKTVPQAEEGENETSGESGNTALAAVAAPPIGKTARALTEAVSASVEDRASGERPAPVEGPEKTTLARRGDATKTLQSSGGDPVEASTAHARGSALAALLTVWKRSPLTAPPEEESFENVRSYAARHGMASFWFRPTIDQILLINQPVLVRLRGEETVAWAAFLGFKDKRAKLLTSDGDSLLLPLPTLKYRYDSEAVFFWSDLAPGQENLRAWTSGADVSEFQEDLRALYLLESNPTGVYDAATVQRVTQIQRATGLAADGIVGPRTRMVVQGWLERYATPSLSGRSYSDAIREQVTASQGLIREASSDDPREAEIQALTSLEIHEPSLRDAGSERESGTDTDGQPPLPNEADLDLPSFGAASDDTAALAQETVRFSGETGYLGAERVDVEQLDGPRYRALLNTNDYDKEDGLTVPSRQITPIVPRATEADGSLNR